MEHTIFPRRPTTGSSDIQPGAGAFQGIMLHHKALRLSVTHTEEGWFCSYLVPASLPLTFVDLMRRSTCAHATRVDCARYHQTRRKGA